VPLRILDSDLLTNATDVEIGDILTLVGFRLPAPTALPIFTNAAYVLYSLPPGGNVPDTFTQIVSDGLDSTDGAVLITIAADSTGTNFNQVSSNLVSGLPAVTFVGIPCRSYHVRRTTDLTGTPTWTDLITTNTPAGSLFQFVDPNSLVETRIYRAINK
jgi:hypothetical protein